MPHESKARIVAGKFVFRSTEGTEQQLHDLLTDVAKAAQEAPETEWYEFAEDVLLLKNKLLAIGARLEAKRSSGK